MLIPLQKQFASKLNCILFSLKVVFIWEYGNSNDSDAIQQIPEDLRLVDAVQSLPSPNQYVLTLGVEWNSHTDCFRLAVSNLPPLENSTKRGLVSDVASTFDVLGWFAPAIKNLIAESSGAKNRFGWHSPRCYMWWVAKIVIRTSSISNKTHSEMLLCQKYTLPPTICAGSVMHLKMPMLT